MSETAAKIVLCTLPDIDQARQIGTSMVREQLAACVNLIPRIESIYRWKGEVETAGEVLAIFKTTPDSYPALERALREAHPYEVPEILAFRADSGLAEYLSWVAGEVRE